MMRYDFNIDLLISEILDKEIPYIEDLNDLIYRINCDQDMNYEFLCDEISDQKFNTIWNKASNWLIDAVDIKEHNNWLLESMLYGYSGYDGFYDLLEDINYGMIEYPSIYIMFNIDGDQSDIVDEPYNNDGLMIEI